MKESVKLARMKLATGALQALYAAGSGRIEDLFVASKPSSKPERDEATDRAWQMLVMDGLASDGVLEYADEGVVSITDKERLSEILANTEEDGLLLSEYVFPARRRAQGEPPADAEPTDAPSAGSDDEAVKLLGVLVEAVSQNHRQFHDSLLKMAGGLDGTARGFNELLDKLKSNDARDQEADRKINNRLDKLEERWGGTQRVVESMQTTLKTIAQELVTFNGNVRAMVEMSAEVKAGAAAMARLAKETEVAGRLRTLAGDIAAHTSETKALHESCLELATRLEDSEPA